MTWYSIFIKAPFDREWVCDFDGKAQKSTMIHRCCQLEQIPVDVRLFAGKEIGKLILELGGDK